MVNEKLNKNRYGCRKPNHEIFKLKDKVFCGYCNRKMYPVSAISSNGNHLRYYTCISTKKDNCANKRIYKDFLEGCVNKVIHATFNNPTNLENISNKVYEVHKKRANNKNSLNALKNDLQRVNSSIANIMTAIEKGVITNTTKTRLEELEKQQIELQQKVIIEQSKERYELTKEDIQNFFKYTIKEFPNQIFEYLIKFVRVYRDKIEIGLNYMLNPIENNNEPIIQKVFTEIHETQRIFKGNSIKTMIDRYDIYIIL